VAISLAPSGEMIAYTVQDSRTRTTAREQRYSWIMRTGAPVALSGSSVWVCDTRTGSSHRLSSPVANSWSPVWSPDGRYLAYNSDRGGEARVWLWEKSSGRQRELPVSATSGFVFDGVQWTPDSTRLVVRTTPDGIGVERLLDLLYGKRQEMHEGISGPQSVSVLEYDPLTKKQTDPMEANGSKGFDLLLCDLAIVDVRSGRVHRIYRKIRPYFYRVSPDGKYVAVMSFDRLPTVSSAQALWTFSLASLDTYESRIVESNVQWDLRPISWSMNSRKLAYSTRDFLGNSHVVVIQLPTGDEQSAALPAGFSRANTFCFEGCPWLWDASGQTLYSVADDAIWKLTLNLGTAAKVTELADHQMTELIAARSGSLLWQRTGGKSVIVVTRNQHTLDVGFFEVDLDTGQHTRLLEEAKYYHRQSHSIVDLSTDGKTMVFLAESAQECEDLWLLNTDSGSSRQVTRINSTINHQELGRSRSITWRSGEGENLKGALLLPAGYESGKRYPLIVYVYGGENLSDWLNRWSPAVLNMQLLSTRGYAILFPDAPLRVGRPMEDLALTVLPGVQKTIEMGIADPLRLGIIGHSYGGYSTLALVEQFKQFKAAIDISGETNLVNAYAKTGSAGGIGWVEEGQGRMGGSLWRYPDRFVKNSPVFQLDKVETPILIIQGGMDTDVDPIESNIAFESLRRLGKPATYVRYEVEEHSPLNWGHANQMDYIKRVIAWFDKYVKGTPDPSKALHQP
jgi:dipeptidyl aminopeptidase/acylaminoacyl peptidase